jgi:polysaccharide export outer membrane protein
MYSAYFIILRAISVLVMVFVIFTGFPASAEDYFLGPGDVINITVYDNKDLDTLARVSDDGNIIMPLLGQVSVNGLSISLASERIAALLADGFIINPQVNIFVKEFRSKKAVVLGQVNRPGIIEMSGPITFLELISKAGGLASEYGETATIKRQKNSAGNGIITIDLNSLIEGGDVSQNTLIRDGDTIYVSKAGMCYVNGEVNRPDAYKCGDGITVLKLITLAGGFTGKASKSSVRIFRIINGEKTLYKNVELDTPVQPDDVIIVPESFF